MAERSPRPPSPQFVDPETGDASWCQGVDAAFATVPHSDFPGTTFFKEQSAVASAPGTVISTSTFSFDRERQHTTVVNSLSGVVLSGSVLNRHASPAKQVWANCEASLAASQPSTIFSFIEQQGWAPVFTGGAAVNGVAARRFTFSNGGRFSPSVDYFDDAVTHTPLRVAVSVGGSQRMFIDILNFTALPSTAALSWPGPALDETGEWGAACPGAVVVPAGAALYPGAPPLGFVTSFLPPPVVPVSSDSSTSASGRHLLLASSTVAPPLPPRPPPSPSPPPRPPPPPPCPSATSQTWLVCYSDQRGCSLVAITTCQNITTVAVGSKNATLVSGRRLLQTDASFFLGQMVAAYDNYQQQMLSQTTDPVYVDLSFSFWPAAAKSSCMAYYASVNCTAQCQIDSCQALGASLGSNGTVTMTPAYGTLTLPYAKRAMSTGGFYTELKNSTYIGLTGGESMTIAPPQPGFPFNSSQFPVSSCTKDVCFVGRVWWFVDGYYKQVRTAAAVCIPAPPCADARLLRTEHVHFLSHHRAYAVHRHRKPVWRCAVFRRRVRQRFLDACLRHLRQHPARGRISGDGLPRTACTPQQCWLELGFFRRVLDRLLECRQQVGMGVCWHDRVWEDVCRHSELPQLPRLHSRRCG